MTTTDLNALTLQLARAKKDNEYILGDEVRIECSGDFAITGDGKVEYLGTHGKDYSRCDCESRGWHPWDEEKIGKWMEAAEKGFPKDSIYKNLYTGKWHGHVNQLKGYECSKGKTPTEAFFLALSNAVQILSEEK